MNESLTARDVCEAVCSVTRAFGRTTMATRDESAALLRQARAIPASRLALRNQVNDSLCNLAHSFIG